MAVRFCPVRHCCQTMGPKQVVCVECWRKLPATTREKIAVYWTASQSRVFNEAVQEAIAWLSDKAESPS